MVGVGSVEDLVVVGYLDVLRGSGYLMRDSGFFVGFGCYWRCWGLGAVDR